MSAESQSTPGTSSKGTSGTLAMGVCRPPQARPLTRQIDPRDGTTGKIERGGVPGMIAARPETEPRHAAAKGVGTGVPSRIDMGFLRNPSIPGLIPSGYCGCFTSPGEKAVIVDPASRRIVHVRSQ